MNTLKIQSLQALSTEMTAVASGERKVPVDASQTSFELVDAMALLLTRVNRAMLAAIVQRAEPNVSRTLSKIVHAGFVNLH